MGSHELDRLLRRLHAPRRRDRAAHRRHLAAELQAEHGRFQTPKRWTMIKQTTWFRPALACLGVLILGVAACNAPTEYEVEMGQQLTLTMDRAAKSGDDPFDQIQEMVAFAEAWPGADSVWVSVNEEDGGPVTVDLMVWGQGFDADGLVAALVEQFPVLADAQLEITPLSGMAEGNLGDALGHAFFDLEVTGETAEEIRANILAQIAAQGFTGDAVVEVDEADGVQTIRVDLVDITEEGDGAAGETEDTLIIELKDE